VIPRRPTSVRRLTVVTCVVLGAYLLASCRANPPTAASRVESGHKPVGSCTKQPSNVSWHHLDQGSWTRHAPPPFPRARAVTVWTGTELLLWGGDSSFGGTHHADGAAYDPEAGSWRKLPPGPLSGRSLAGAAWTGCEVVIWGGYGPNERRFGDGAAYDPATDSWRSIAHAPIGARMPLAAVWTGREMIVWGSYERPAGAADGAAYDPDRDTWRRIAPAPRRLNFATTVWTGTEMIVVGARLDNNNASRTAYAVGLAYNPRRDAWRELPGSRLSPQSSALAWSGTDVIAWDYALNAQAYDPRSDRWRSLPRAPLRSYECYPQTVEIGSFVMAWYCGQAALWDIVDGAWHRINTPAPIVPGSPTAAGGVVLFAGATHESTHNSLWAYRPPST
jgi:hypothetical protein